MQHVTTTGTALAVALLPLAVGVLLAKTMAGDPLAPVNALITSGGQRARVSPSQWRGCGRTALSRWKAERTEGLRRSDDSRARRCIGRLRDESRRRKRLLSRSGCATTSA
ncbi:hypothetical protein AR457_03175 [Streptomyces agglomeratus]|uniref:Uncharacterized protein n=2 Tax=Streptomyces agglomeratus TaxID=285458 RepID=A0A1E5P2R2_9ACTN|nr:hypothetical protein AS594_03280 [Streptomyces agglomeratus]OEJ43236.1 hypothetical protein AR457_03175 [Streptomyces agglomeratus]OEJ54843.1 hypothetical protein BGK72_32595 [Streptomyces agglomeratus]OEJ62214.1 hypothetical protein BGM19_33510 [Streptomyces agglomeratus]